MIQELNLCLVNTCNANCIFCPVRSYNHVLKFMSMELVEEIIRQVQSEEFRTNHNLLNMNIGENGEATLHPHLVEILERLRTLGCQMNLFTNFSNLTMDKSLKIVMWKLVDSVHTNIDGEHEDYELTKGLSYETFLVNLTSFLRCKHEMEWATDKIPVHAHVVSAENYRRAAKRHFGEEPSKLPVGFDSHVFKSSARGVKEKFEQMEGIAGVAIDDCLMWAERPFRTFRKEGNYSCPIIGRVETNVFINPNGDWYICCFDSGNEVVLGNIWENSIHSIYSSERRADIIRALKEKRFDDIGLPCSKVDCCQVINPN